MNTKDPAARILVVDDLEVNRDLLARRVGRLGHEAGFAENGRAALAQLAASKWDLVLLDITMPEMDGYETLRLIKDDPALVDIPVIMVSAIDEIDSVVRCIELGADDYLSKPFNPVILQARIESSLSKKRLADQKEAYLQALARELEIGRRIQQGFLPQRLPKVERWRIAALCEPARQVGGDFYDALILPGGRLAFVVADICDKGVGAALYMALFRSLLRVQLGQAPAGEDSAAMLARCLAVLNDYIATEHDRDNMFATLFVGILDPDTGHIDYVNAGHDPPMLHRRAGGSIERLTPTGPAVGLFPGLRQPTASTDLAVGDRLIVYTDGMTEARGDLGALGESRLIELLAAHGGNVNDWLALAAECVRAHVGDHDRHDDVTLLCLQREA
ncbi:Phosphoserine phosphatase RsbU [Burkholderiales bacterium]|nr:Phosphoserine phosphatase RsbU [Burkholderiales bacterium]